MIVLKKEVCPVCAKTIKIGQIIVECCECGGGGANSKKVKKSLSRFREF